MTKGADYQRVLDLIWRLYEGRQKIMDAYDSYLEACAQALIDYRWAHIERLAATLLEQKTIKGHDAVEMAILGPNSEPPWGGGRFVTKEIAGVQVVCRE